MALSLAAGATYVLGRTPLPAAAALELVAAVCGAPGALREVAARRLERSVRVSLGREPLEPVRRAELTSRVAVQRLASPGCSLSLQDWSLEPSGAGDTWVVGTLVSSTSQPGDLHAERRAARGLFRGEEEPRLVELHIAEPERGFPEARP